MFDTIILVDYDQMPQYYKMFIYTCYLSAKKCRESFFSLNRLFTSFRGDITFSKRCACRISFRRKFLCIRYKMKLYEDLNNGS